MTRHNAFIDSSACGLTALIFFVATTLPPGFIAALFLSHHAHFAMTVMVGRSSMNTSGLLGVGGALWNSSLM